MIMNSTGERNLTKIREMMKRLQFDHNEVINELIESSQKSSINDDETNSKKAVGKVTNESIENLEKSSTSDNGSNSNKITNGSIENSEKISVNDDGSNSKKA